MKKTIRIIGIPMDLGQTHRGVDMGPSAIHYAGLAKAIKQQGYEVDDVGNLLVPLRYALKDISEKGLYSAIQQGCQAACQAAIEALEADESPIFLGGDHTIALGSISGLALNQRLGVIWLDAHSDCNTPDTSPTGNIHGMPLAMLLGQGHHDLVNLGHEGTKLLPEDVVLMGVRNLDQGEKNFLRDRGVLTLTMRDIDERGMAECMRVAIEHLSHCKSLHVSLDLDCLDPQVAPGVGTPCPGGLTYREAQLAMEIIADSGRCGSIDVVEVNPILDHSNKTAQVAVELIASLAGKSIM